MLTFVNEAPISVSHTLQKDFCSPSEVHSSKPALLQSHRLQLSFTKYQGLLLFLNGFTIRILLRRKCDCQYKNQIISLYNTYSIFTESGITLPSCHANDTVLPPLAFSPDTLPFFHSFGSAGKRTISPS